MPLPNTFAPHEVAAAAEVNANFKYLNDIVGSTSTTTLMTLPGALRVGNGFLSAATNNYLSLGWNVQEQKNGSTRKFVRIQNNLPATIAQVGVDGFTVYTTSAKTGDINAQLKPVFGIHATTGEDYMLLDKTWSIQTSKTQGHIEDYRQTYVQFNTPQAVFEDWTKFYGAGTQTYDATKYWVPKNAKMIRVLIHCTATYNSGSALMVMEARKSRHKKYGMIVHAYGGEAAGYGRSAGQGDVPLGTGAYAGQFVVERTAAMETASLWIQGYWL